MPPEHSAAERAGFDPSSFVALVSGLGAQAKILLGQLQNPLTGKTEDIDLPRAQILIATLEMMGEKTRGNLSDAEDKFLANILADLRLSFVQQSQAGDGD